MADLSSNFSASVKGSTAYGDLLMVDGDFVFTSDLDTRGANPVFQDVFYRLHTYQGEWAFDTSIGVPWFQQILGNNLTDGRVRDMLLQNAITQTPGVQELVSYKSTVNAQQRTVSISFVANTVVGIVRYQGGVGNTSGAA